MSFDARRELADAADRYYWLAAENFQWRLNTPFVMEMAVWRKNDVTRQSGWFGKKKL